MMTTSIIIGPMIGLISGAAGLVPYHEGLINFVGAILVSLVVATTLFYLSIKARLI